MPRPHIEPFDERIMDYKRMTLPGFGKGMHYKVLSMDIDSGACSLKVKFEGGYKLPPGMSYSELEMFIVSGSITYGDTNYGEGYYFLIPPGVSMPAMKVSQGAVVIMFYNYGEPSFVASDEDHPLAERYRLSIINSTEDINWMPGNRIVPSVASGCMLKLLKYDLHTEAHTFLFCMTPGFQQDNISYHDCCEEVYHIWGTSWMMQFGDVPTGGYFWRPPYINHGAFYSKHGIIAIGRTDAHLHNYFHFNPWTSPKENADRAAARFRRMKPSLYKWVRAPEGHNHFVDFEYPHYHDHDHDHD